MGDMETIDTISTYWVEFKAPEEYKFAMQSLAHMGHISYVDRVEEEDGYTYVQCIMIPDYHSVQMVINHFLHIQVTNLREVDRVHAVQISMGKMTERKPMPTGWTYNDG